MKKFIWGAVVSSLALTACPAPPLQPTEVRFFNAVPDATGMQVFVARKLITPLGGGVIFRNAFPSASTYETVTEGTLTFSLCPVAPSCAPEVDNRTASLQANKKTTLALIGTEATNDNTGADARPLDVMTISHETPAPATGKARMQIIHLAAAVTAKTVDLFVTEPSASLDNIVPPPISYKGIQPYRDFAPGAFRIRVTAPSVTDTVLVDSDTLTLEAGKTYTAIITNPNPANSNKGVTLLVDR
jgi:hypothetical protein